MEYNIVYAADDNYAFLAGISMLSLFENNKSLEKCNAYILSDNIHKDNIEKLKSVGELYGRDVTILDTSQQLKLLKSYGIKGYDNSDKKGLTAYARLSIGDILPKLGRALYLDCDTMVNGDISEAYEMNLNGKAVALAYDCLQCRYKKYIGLDYTERYYNTGVMLIDLDVWRKHKCSEKLLKQLEKGINYPLVDQDLINVVLRDDIRLLPMKFNYLSNYFLYDHIRNYRVYEHRKGAFWSKSQWIDGENAVSDVRIFHFAGATLIRPWFLNSYHPLKKQYDKYYYLSPWKNMNQVKYKLPLPYKIQYFLYRYTSAEAASFIGWIMQMLFIRMRYGV